jgi:lipid A disaccharide synthetase
VQPLRLVFLRAGIGINAIFRPLELGSLEMENLGFERLGKSEEMAVVGAAEIITHYKHLKSVFDRLVEEAARRRPRVVIVMDYQNSI